LADELLRKGFGLPIMFYEKAKQALCLLNDAINRPQPDTVSQGFVVLTAHEAAQMHDLLSELVRPLQAHQRDYVPGEDVSSSSNPEIPSINRTKAEIEKDRVALRNERGNINTLMKEIDPSTPDYKSLQCRLLGVQKQLSILTKEYKKAA
jgi:hypothetical protein